MFQSEHLQEKWSPLLDYEGLDPIKDSHRRAVTAVLLENQERFLREEQAFSSGINLMETPTNSANVLVHQVVLVQIQLLQVLLQVLTLC